MPEATVPPALRVATEVRRAGGLGGQREWEDSVIHPSSTPLITPQLLSAARTLATMTPAGPDLNDDPLTVALSSLLDAVRWHVAPAALLAAVADIAAKAPHLLVTSHTTSTVELLALCGPWTTPRFWHPLVDWSAVAPCRWGTGGATAGPPPDPDVILDTQTVLASTIVRTSTVFTDLWMWTVADPNRPHLVPSTWSFDEVVHCMSVPVDNETVRTQFARLATAITATAGCGGLTSGADAVSGWRTQLAPYRFDDHRANWPSIWRMLDRLGQLVGPDAVLSAAAAVSDLCGVPAARLFDPRCPPSFSTAGVVGRGKIRMSAIIALAMSPHPDSVDPRITLSCLGVDPAILTAEM